MSEGVLREGMADGWSQGVSALQGQSEGRAGSLDARILGLKEVSGDGRKVILKAQRSGTNSGQEKTETVNQKEAKVTVDLFWRQSEIEESK